MNKESINLLETISENNGFHSSIFLTYGADLGFYEQAILSKLRQNGCFNNLIFMDAERYKETITNLRDTVEWVGRRYTVTPINLNPFQSFHPKLFLFVGYEKSRLLIGSGNLTFTGLGKNQEVFTCIDYEYQKTNNSYLFQQVWDLIIEIIKKYPTPKQVEKTLRKIELSSPFKNETGIADDRYIFLHSLRTPLIDQVVPMVQGEKVKEIIIFSPFIDKNAIAIKSFAKKFSPKVIKLILQNSQVMGNPKSLLQIQKDGIPLQIFEFIGTDKSYLHAKILQIQTNQHDYLITGSANCTDSAWIRSAANGNLETVICRKILEKGYFNYLIKGKFKSDKPISPTLLTWKANPEITKKGKESISLIDAEYDGKTVYLIFELKVTLKENSVVQFVMENGTSIEIDNIGKMTNGIINEVIIPTKEIEINRPTPVFLRIINRDSNTIEGASSSLWMNLTSELNDPRQKVPASFVKASELLGKGLVESDEEWKELFDAIQYIVDLGIKEIQQNPSKVFKTKPEKEKQSSEESSKNETKVVLWDPEELETSDTFGGSIQSEWVDSILQLVRSQLTFSSESSGRKMVEHPDPNHQGKGINHKQIPTSSMEMKFQKLIKRYAKLLFNETYMKNVGFENIPAFFYIFNRILWILKNHEGIQEDIFYKLLRDINTGIFGVWEEKNPALEPRLQRHLQRIFQHYWQRQPFIVYALCNAMILRDYGQNSEDEIIRKEINLETIKILTGCSIISVVNFSMESQDIFDDIVELIHMPKGELMSSYDKFLIENSTNAYELLEKWQYELSRILDKEEDKSRRKILFQRIEDYSVARYNLSTLIHEQDLQIQACSDVIFSTQKLAHNELEIEFLENLKPLLNESGQISELARNNYETAKLEEQAGNKPKAYSLFILAGRLANEVGNFALARLCEIHTNWLYKG